MMPVLRGAAFKPRFAGAEPTSWTGRFLDHPASWCMRALVPSFGMRCGSAGTRVALPATSLKLSEQTGTTWNLGKPRAQLPTKSAPVTTV